MSEENKGLEAARATAAKIKSEVAQEQQIEEEGRKEAMNQLAAIGQNKELADMYRANANVGADNLGGELPLLKVHATGKSTKNELANGTEPTDGWFFYKVTGEQYESIRCHVLTISRGFKALDMNGKEKFQQILAGVIIDGSDLKPFIMYVTGIKLAPMWEFGKAAKKYTHMKPVAIPMFALTVQLTTVKEKGTFGTNWKINFDIEKDENGFPKLVMDPGEFTFLKDQATDIEETINGLITSKSVKTEEEEIIPGQVLDSSPTTQLEEADGEGAKELF